MKKITLFALCAILLTACGPKSYPEFENDLNAFREEIGNVGLGVAVVKDNKIIYDNYFGVKDLETGEEVDAQTIFRIASISKSFTATSLMQLVGPVSYTHLDVYKRQPFAYLGGCIGQNSGGNLFGKFPAGIQLLYAGVEMCIRDSIRTMIRRAAAPSVSSACSSVKIRMNGPGSSRKPVSYTHLDVYKRQVQGGLSSSLRSASAAAGQFFPRWADEC